MPKGRILRVKEGYNPNSSSIGSLIFSMSAAIIPATVIFGMVAGAISSAILQRVGRRTEDNPKTSSKPAKGAENVDP